MIAINKGYQLIFHTGNLKFLKKEYLDHINLNDKYITYQELLFEGTFIFGGR